MKETIAIFGSQGAIGQALVQHYLTEKSKHQIFCFSRKSPNHLAADQIKHFTFELSCEESIKQAAGLLEGQATFDKIIIATGVLHQDEHLPEKSIRQLNSEFFLKTFTINTLGPALIAKYFTPLLNKEKKSIFAALSARVGSLSDNRLGGWYSYRCSKAALNMLIKTLSVEFLNKNPQAIFLGLHPGTVQSPLSAPFTQNKDPHTLFSPATSAEHLVKVLEKACHEDSGFIFDWKGERIEY